MISNFNKTLHRFPIFLAKCKETKGGSKHLHNTMCQKTLRPWIWLVYDFKKKKKTPEKCECLTFSNKPQKYKVIMQIKKISLFLEVSGHESIKKTFKFGAK